MIDFWISGRIANILRECADGGIRDCAVDVNIRIRAADAGQGLTVLQGNWNLRIHIVGGI